LRDSLNELVNPATDTEAEEALKIAQSLQAHEEQAFMVRRMWELKEYQASINSEAIHNCINHHTTMLALSMLADFMLLGSVTATGSWALGDVKKEVLEKSLMKYINAILRVINKYLINQLIEANYTTQRLPELVCAGLSEEDLRAWAETMQILVNATLLKGDKTLRADVREKFSLPKEDEEEPAPEAAITQTFRLLSECDCGGRGHRTLTEREQRLGMTDEHRVALKDTLQKAQDAFVIKARPIWEEMKASLVEQLKDGKKAADIEVPEKLKVKYRQNLYDTYMAQEVSGASSVAKELKKPIDEKAFKSLMEKKATLVSNALADKDCMDLKYFVRLEEARRLGRK
jgi:phage gp29-like protein